MSRSQGTVHATKHYDPESDAQQLRDAMKGLGTDEAAIIAILAKRTREERVQLSVLYKSKFGRDLIKDLDSELGGQLEHIINCLIMPEEEYDARELHRAMKGVGTDEDAMLEILCTRDSEQIRAINKIYQTLFNSKLEDNIVSETSGNFQRLLVSLSVGGRHENEPVDKLKAQVDAQRLYEAGEEKFGTDESVFNQILVPQGFDQLEHVFNEYERIAGHTLQEAIETEMSGALKDGLLAIVKSVLNRPAYFAEKLYNSMKGAGTDDQAVIRIVVTRCEVDMVEIKRQFKGMYEVTLAEMIQGDFSGDAQKILVVLVGEN